MRPQRIHLERLDACPFLPPAPTPILASSMKSFGKTNRGPEFYLQALRCAQSLWRQGLPAQALLLLNRALGADLAGGEAVLAQWPLPYAAVAWVMRHRCEGQFVGDPVRHYRHLASRMVEPRKEQRAWRAWGCWYLACRILPEEPAGEKQIAEEGLVEPGREEILSGLAAHGIAGEGDQWEAAIPQQIDLIRPF